MKSNEKWKLIQKSIEQTKQNHRISFSSRLNNFLEIFKKNTKFPSLEKYWEIAYWFSTTMKIFHNFKLVAFSLFFIFSINSLLSLCSFFCRQWTWTFYTKKKLYKIEKRQQQKVQKHEHHDINIFFLIKTENIEEDKKLFKKSLETIFNFSLPSMFYTSRIVRLMTTAYTRKLKFELEIKSLREREADLRKDDENSCKFLCFSDFFSNLFPYSVSWVC